MKGTLLIFDMERVKELVAWNIANTQASTMEQMFDGKFYPDGEVIYKNNDPEGWPDHSKMDLTKLPRALHMVKDRGIYLMSGTKEHCPATEREIFGEVAQCVYAKGLRPEEYADEIGRVNMHMGGDDAVFDISIQWVVAVLKRDPKAAEMKIRVSRDQIALELPPSRGKAPEGPSMG
jgi:hypothetical protein